MGVVYHAFDTVMRRDVALKTLRDVPSGAFLDLFSRECSVLAAMVHPNVVEIFDMGEFEDEGVSKPFFVMPLLPGSTLHDLIYPANAPLSTTRCIDIISQACRGLQAAHEQQLVHQDIKPRNIFVMRDDAVKIIDFGVAHLGIGNSTGIRGTLKYMSPEQLSFKGLTHKSDIFSLAVVCYEALTAAHPFVRRADRRDPEPEIAEAITSYLPPLVSDLNSSVNRAVAQVVAKGMAKDVWNRYESAAAFAEALQKALRNESPVANHAVVRARLERARRSFEEKDFQFASEIVNQLEAEGHSDPEIADLRANLERAVLRERSNSLITAAERCFNNDEHALALRKIQEVLEFDSTNSSALSLKKRIESTLTEQKIAELLKIATDHLDRFDITGARHAVQDALKLRPSDTRARQLLTEVDARQKEILRQRQEQERLYQSAQAAFFSGKIDLAIENLNQLGKLTSIAGEIPNRSSGYQELHKRVYAEYNALKAALAEAQRLVEHDLSVARKICDRYLGKYSDQPDLIALSQVIQVRRKELELAFRQSIAAQVEGVDSPEERLRILEGANKSHPEDDYIKKEIDSLRKTIGVIKGIEVKARALERQNDFQGALNEWEKLRGVYPRFPGLDDHLTRVRNSLERIRLERRAKLVTGIEDALQSGHHETCGDILSEAENEFPGDNQLALLRSQMQAQVEKSHDVSTLLGQARQCSQGRNFAGALQALGMAGSAGQHVPHLIKNVFDASLDQAELAGEAEWRAAKAILDQAVSLGSGFSVPPRYWGLIQAGQREEGILDSLHEAQLAETGSDLDAARDTLRRALERYGDDRRLQASLISFENEITARRRREERDNDLRQVQFLHSELRQTEDSSTTRGLAAQSKAIAERHKQDPEIGSLAQQIETQVAAFESCIAALAHDDLSTCFRICNEILGAQPDHLLFLNVKASADARQHEKATAFLEQCARQLAGEPDLARRREILESALQEYPDEQYFSDELKLVLDKRAVVETIAQRAKSLEADGLAVEALDEWAYLKTIYPIFPGVDQSIEKCNALLREKREKARASAHAAINKALNDREYDEALRRVRQAQHEFPEDETLSGREELISRRLNSRQRANEWLEAAEGKVKTGDFRGGLTDIQQALECCDDEPEIRNSIASTLLRHAASAVSANVETAEALVAEAKLADSSVTVPKKLRASLLEARTRFDLNDFLARAVTREAAGDFAGALQLAHEFLVKYSSNAEALAFQKRLLAAQAEDEKKRKRAQDISDLDSIRHQARTVTTAQEMLQLLKRAEQITRQSSKDAEVSRIGARLSRMLSAFAQLQQLTEDGQLHEAEELCAKSLAEFPQDPTLANWRTEIEIRQNAKAAEYLRQVEQKLTAQPDFLKQQQILENAIQEYPEENYYSDELALIRNKQLLLEAEIARARDFESKELYEDAQREWENLHKTYPWYAGVEEELNRLRRILEMRATAARNNWLGKINSALKVVDLDLADSLFADASIDLAGDPVLRELQLQIEKIRSGRQQRAELVSQGRQAFAEGRASDGVSRLGQAAKMFSEDYGFRDWVLDLLFREARKTADSDWRSCELLLEEIQRIHSKFPVPEDLKAAIASRKKESEVSLLVENVQRAESEGDLKAAKRLLDDGLAKYPGEQPLILRRNAVIERMQRLALEKARDESRQQTDKARSQLLLADSKRKLTKLRSNYTAQGMAASDDMEISSIAKQFIAEIDRKLALAPEGKSAINRLWVVAAALILLAGAGTVWIIRKPAPLAVEVSKVAPAPPSPTLHIAGNITAGDVYLDQVKIGTLTGGSIDLPQLSPGTHTLRLSSSEGTATVPILQDAATGPRINALISADHVSVTAISTSSQATMLTTSVGDVQPVLLDDRSAGSIKPGPNNQGSLVLPVLQPGNHHLQIGPPGNAPTFDVIVPPKPSLSLLITGGSPTGRLEVRTNVPGAELFIDGKRYGSESDRTFHLILPAKTYRVYAAHEGYSSSDTTQVEVAKGSQVAVDLKLLPRNATLELAAGPADIEVSLDGTSLTRLAADQSISRQVPAGSHRLTIARSGYVSKQLQRTFDPGQTIVLGASDLGLSPVQPDLAAAEAQDWKRLKGSRNVGDLQTFVQRFPNGPHVQAANQSIQQIEWDGIDKTNAASLTAYAARHPQGEHSAEARQLVDQLAKSDASRREQSAWDAVDKHNRDALNDFLSKYASGAHSDAARQLMADLAKAEEQSTDEAAWKSVNRSDRASISSYLSRFPSGRYASQARDALASLSQRLGAQADSAAVLAVIQKFAAAWSAKDLSAIVSLQPSLTRRELKAKFENVRVWNMTLTPLGAPQINGNHATVTCRREISETFADGTKKDLPPTTATYVLRSQGSSWVIDDFN